MDSSQEELEKERDEFVRDSIEKEEYFKDAKDWYSIAYILPYTERGFFVLLSIIGILVTYLFLIIIASALPLKERLSVVIEAKDTALYEPTIKSLVNKKEAKSTDEAVLRFLIINYLKEREEHNYKKADIKEVNIKLDKIKNNSSTEAFEEFKKFMSQSNPNSPIHFFGKNVERNIEIKSFNFVQAKKLTIFDKMKGFLAMYSLPTKAYITYTSDTVLPNKVIKENKRAELTFKFNGINIDKKTKEYLPLNFIVVEYKKFDD